MNISIEKKLLADAMHIVARFAEKRNTTLPALSAVLVIASDDGIKLRATNLETGIDYKLDGSCKEQGVAAVPATLFQQLALSLSGNGAVTLVHSGEIISLTSQTGKSSIKTIPYDDFPSIPFPEDPKNRIVVSGSVMRALLTSIAACASSSNIRPELASILIKLEGGVLTAVATDSFRLAEKRISLPNKGIQGSFLIPAKNALEIAQALPDEDIIISFDEHQCAFVSTTATFVSRLTAASYPDYTQIIPKDFVVEATVLRKDFEQALKRTAIFSDAYQKIRISFEPKKKQVFLFARNTDIGESSEAVHAQMTGSELELSFNHRYVSAMLSLTTADSITLSAAGIGRPLIVRGTGDSSLLYLVSPMNQ